MSDSTPDGGGIGEGLDAGGRRAARTACQYHCCACGGHFSSLAAFDAHRRGEPGARHCDPDVANSAGEAMLVPKTENGSCAMVYPPLGSGAVVYATRDWWRAAEVFGR